MVSRTSMRQRNKLGVPASNTISAVSDRAGIDPSAIKEALLHFQVLLELTHTCCRPASEFPGGRRASDQAGSEQPQKRELLRAGLAESLAALKDNLESNSGSDADTERYLADALVRLLDIAGEYDLDLTSALIERLAYDAELESQR